MGVGTGYRSGTATPGAASFVGTGMTSLPSAGNLSGIVPTAPATPKRIMSSQRLSELVHNPMAGATAAASGTMAEQERESFSQLAAEASGVASAAATTANGTADGTPLDSITPAGSLGAFGTQTLATSLSVVGAPGGLRVSIGGECLWCMPGWTAHSQGQHITLHNRMYGLVATVTIKGWAANQS